MSSAANKQIFLRLSHLVGSDAGEVNALGIDPLNIENFRERGRRSGCNPWNRNSVGRHETSQDRMREPSGSFILFCRWRYDRAGDDSKSNENCIETRDHFEPDSGRNLSDHRGPRMGRGYVA